jgi:hypothetical protein
MAESAVVGALLVDPGAAASCNGRLKPALFANPFHKRVLREIASLREGGQTPDLPTVTRHLHGRPDAPPEGWALWLTDAATQAAAPGALEATIALLERAEATRRLERLKSDLAAADFDAALALLATARDDVAEPLQAAKPPLEAMGRAGDSLWVPWDERERLNRPIVIDKHLRQGETMEIAGAAKGRKTWLALELARAVASGGRFLDTFQCARGAVAFFDFESSEETIAFRLSSIASPTEAARIRLYSLRRDTGAGTVEAIRAELERTKPTLAIVDCLYAVPGFPLDENSNAEAAAFRRQFVAVAEATGTAIALLHHTPKGAGIGRAVVDRGRGASSAAAVCDCVASVTPDGGGPGYILWERAARTFAPEEPLVALLDIDAQPWAWVPTGTAPVTPKQGPPQKVTDADILAAVGAGATLREIADRLPETVDNDTLRRRLRGLCPARLRKVASKSPTGADGPTRWEPSEGR